MNARAWLSRSGSGLGLLFGYAWLAGLVPALPLALWLGGVVGQWPGGERTLAEPGGVMLLEVLRSSTRELAVTARAWPAWLALVSLAAIVPQGALIAQLASRERASLLDAVARSVRCAPPLLAVSAAHLLARVVAAAVFAFFAASATVMARSRLGELAVVAAVAALGGLGACALRLVADAAAARVLAADRRAGPALLDALDRCSWRAFAQVVAAAALGVVTWALALYLAHVVGSETGAQALVGAALRLLSLGALVVARAIQLTVAARVAV